MRTEETPPILSHKHYDAASAFTPENLSARSTSPERLVLQPPFPKSAFSIPMATWFAIYAVLDWPTAIPVGLATTPISMSFVKSGHEYGIVGCAVGAAFAVLVAEELFASGCQFLVSMTSSGQILPVQAPPYFIVIDRALRDEGTSYHYLPPSDYSEADAHLAQMRREALTAAGISVQFGATWTTDAPFRETQEAIDAA